MALMAALQMCSGVGKSGSPRLKSKTRIPSAFICLALAPAARVADGCTAAAILEIGIISAVPRGVTAACGARLQRAMLRHVANVPHRTAWLTDGCYCI